MHTCNPCPSPSLYPLKSQSYLISFWGKKNTWKCYLYTLLSPYFSIVGFLIMETALVKVSCLHVHFFLWSLLCSSVISVHSESLFPGKWYNHGLHIYVLKFSVLICFGQWLLCTGTFWTILQSPSNLLNLNIYARFLHLDSPHLMWHL